jgi:excisionase family DNA binding protein
MAQEDRLLKPGEVAQIFRVDPKTVSRWAKSGKIIGIKTFGGHHRFWESDIRKHLEGERS